MPLGVVTVTSRVLAPLASTLVPGLMATICVAESLTIVAAKVPKFTAVAPARFVPVMVT